MDERELVSQYREKRKAVANLSESLKLQKAELDELEDKILELLETEGKESTATYEGVGYVSQTKPQLHASVLAENRGELADFLKTIGREDMVVPYVFPKTLSGFVKEKIESGESVPDFIKYYLKPSIRFYQV